MFKCELVCYHFTHKESTFFHGSWVHFISEPIVDVAASQCLFFYCNWRDMVQWARNYHFQTHSLPGSSWNNIRPKSIFNLLWYVRIYFIRSCPKGQNLIKLNLACMVTALYFQQRPNVNYISWNKFITAAGTSDKRKLTFHNTIVTFLHENPV